MAPRRRLCFTEYSIWQNAYGYRHAGTVMSRRGFDAITMVDDMLLGFIAAAFRAILITPYIIFGGRCNYALPRCHDSLVRANNNTDTLPLNKMYLGHGDA